MATIGQRIGKGLVATLLCCLVARAQSPGGKQTPVRQSLLHSSLPEAPSQPPSFSISTDALGFSPPAPHYLGQRVAQLSLDFVDESHILFTFRVPGLIRRDANDAEGNEVRQIRAVVLSLPKGEVTAEAMWTLHGLSRYLWMLDDGHFLLRDGNLLQQGDASLALKPRLHFPGHVLMLGLDPSQQLLVVQTWEPPTVASDASSEAQLANSAAQAQKDKNEKPAGIVVRVMERASGKILFLGRARSVLQLPVNRDGGLAMLSGKEDNWLLTLNGFHGESRTVGSLYSKCPPDFEMVSEKLALAVVCPDFKDQKLVAMRLDGEHLWEDLAKDSVIWARLGNFPDGRRMAWETMEKPKNPVGIEPMDFRNPLGPSLLHSVKAPSLATNPTLWSEFTRQNIQIVNAADGSVALTTIVSPALDGGGNVAISPSGRRVAVLNHGAIQVFDLPEPPAWP